MFWPFRKKHTQDDAKLNDFERLIIEADSSSLDDPRQRLYQAIDRYGYSQDTYYNIRSSLYNRLARTGDAFAQCQLGDLAHSQNNISDALRWYTLSAEGGCTEAMYSLGLWYSDAGNGEYSSGGFGYDPVKSFEYFLQAAQKGHLKAMHSVARCFEDGEGVTADSEKAFSWAQQGAENGSWDCCYYLAESIYNNILHPMHNQGKALEWLKKSTEYANRDQFERTVRSMGYIYGGAYLYNSPETPFSDRRKAAYCFTMAYITNHDDDHDVQLLQKTGYRISEQEFAALRNDTINRRLSF